MVKRAVNEIAQKTLNAPTADLFEHQVISPRVVVLIERRNQILQNVLRALLVRRRGHEANEYRRYPAFDFPANYLRPYLIRNTPVILLLILFVNLRHENRPAKLVNNIPQDRLRNLERPPEGPPFLQHPYHFLIVPVVPVAFSADYELNSGALSMFGQFRERGKQNVQRVMFKHLWCFERKRGMVGKMCDCSRILSLIIKYVVIAAAFGNAGVRKHGRY